MNRHQEILELLKSVDPAGVTEATVEGLAVPIESLRTRSEAVRSRYWGWAPVLLAVLIAVPLLLTSIVWVDLTDLSSAELVGTYRGSLLRDGGPGEADVRQWVELVVSHEQGVLSGRLTHSPPGAASLDPDRSVVMPVDVGVEGRVVELLWAPTVGTYEDTTLEQCRWLGWELVFEGDANGNVLTLDRGLVEGQPPAGSEAGEFLSGCPHGERPVTRLVLVRD